LANKAESFIKWSAKLNDLFKKNKELSLTGKPTLTLYRPFVKKWIYWDNDLNERPSSYRGITDFMGDVIYMQGAGSKKDYSCLVTDILPNFQLINNGKGFPQYASKDVFGPVSNLNENILNVYNLDENELIYYIYAILHSSEYKIKYGNDLSKDYPKIPKVKDIKGYVTIGRKLMDLHVNYESVHIYDEVEIVSNQNPSFKVQKMKHLKKGVLDTIIFNNDITIKNIPLDAYDYIVNGKPANQWIMEQYQYKVDKASGIVDDPNLYSDDEKYIFNLLLRVINVSVQTKDLVNSLPPLEIVE